MSAALIAAARAVLARWDSPQWEWVQQSPTADLMHALRAALAAAPEQRPVGELIRGDGGAWRFTCGDHLLAIYSMPAGTHQLYAAAQAPAAPIAPTQAPLTEAFVSQVVRLTQPHLDDTCKAWGQEFAQCKFWLDAERAVLAAAGIGAQEQKP